MVNGDGLANGDIGIGEKEDLDKRFKELLSPFSSGFIGRIFSWGCTV